MIFGFFNSVRLLDEQFVPFFDFYSAQLRLKTFEIGTCIRDLILVFLTVCLTVYYKFATPKKFLCTKNKNRNLTVKDN